MGKKNYGWGRPTHKDIIHYDMQGKPACGVNEGRIFVTWKHDRIDCPECLEIWKQGEALRDAEFEAYESYLHQQNPYEY